MGKDIQTVGGVILGWNFGLWLCTDFEWYTPPTVMDGIVIGGVIWGLGLMVRGLFWVGER